MSFLGSENNRSRCKILVYWNLKCFFSFKGNFLYNNFVQWNISLCKLPFFIHVPLHRENLIVLLFKGLYHALTRRVEYFIFWGDFVSCAITGHWGKRLDDRKCVRKHESYALLSIIDKWLSLIRVQGVGGDWWDVGKKVSHTQITSTANEFSTSFARDDLAS